MPTPLFQLERISLGGRSRRLDEVTCAIHPGVTAVIGSSGAGKTSLLNLLVGFENPDRVRGSSLSCLMQRGRHAMPLYWSPHDGGLWPHLTAKQHLEVVTAGHSPTALLCAFDLTDRAGALPQELSQGERQRVAVARCLAADPAVIVMDEPLAHVDPGRIGRYWQVIRDHLATTGASLVFATHSPATVLAEAQRVICLDRGRVIYEGDVPALYHQPATPHLASCLGPYNWFDRDEAALWLCTNGRATPSDVAPDAATASPSDTLASSRAPAPASSRRPASSRVCIRPERLDVVKTGAGPLIVRRARFCGNVSEVELYHERADQTRRLIHRPASAPLAPGDRVMLRCLSMLVLTATVLLSLTGCGAGRADDQSVLPVRDVRYWSMPTKGARVPAPRSIEITPDDRTIVLDTVGRVLVFDAQGELVYQWEMPEYRVGRPEGTCLLADGRLAVADTHYYRVVLFDAAGRVQSMFGSQGVLPGQFQYPVSITQDDQGYLYVAEYGGNDRVQKFTPDGKFVLSFGTPGTEPGQFQRPQCIRWHKCPDGVGRLYIADVENGRVQVFHEDGTLERIFGQGKGQGPGAGGLGEDYQHFAYPYGVCVDDRDQLYVIEWQGARVAKFDLDGNPIGRFGSPGVGEGQFRTPWAIGVSRAGVIRIADKGKVRVVALVQ